MTPARSQRLGDNPLLGDTVGHRQTTRCAVLVNRAAPDHGPDPVTVADRVLEPLHDDDTATFAAYVAVRGRVEGLAPAVRSQHPRLGEGDHGCRADQDVRAAGQREVTLAKAQRLARLMDRHQRRTARRIDCDRRALQPQPITDPASGCGRRRPDCQIRFDLGVIQLIRDHGQVVMGGQTHEHTGPGVRQGHWRGARMLQRPPCRLQQQPMLWVHHLDLTRRHPEERRVEPRYVIDEACAAGHNLSGRLGILVEEFLDIPPVAGYLGYRVPPLPQHLPELVRIRGAWKARRVADYGKPRCRLDRTLGRCHTVVLPASAGEVSIPGGAPVARRSADGDGQLIFRRPRSIASQFVPRRHGQYCRSRSIASRRKSGWFRQRWLPYPSTEAIHHHDAFEREPLLAHRTCGDGDSARVC